MPMRFEKTIWAVGQGGFSSGTLRDVETGTNFTYVYDCGSNQTRALDREIRTLRSTTDSIEVAFISHLDRDHVNGFDKLVELFDRRVDEIVLPYLDDISRFYVAAQAISQGTASGSFLNFVVDPTTWIRDRLPDARILFLGGASGDSSPPEGFVFGEPPDRGAGGIYSARTLGSPLMISGAEQAEHVEWGAWQSGKSLHPSLFLLATSHPRESIRLAAFKNALSNAGFGNLDSAELRIL